MLIDFFTYTSATEGGRLRPVEIIEAAKAAGLDGVCIVDRDTTASVAEALEAAKAADFFVGVGVEIACVQGSFVLFPSDAESFLVEEEWRQLTLYGAPTSQELMSFCAEREVAVVARRVYARNPRGIGDAVFALKGLSGMDVLSPNRKRIENEMSLEAADGLGLAALAGSESFEAVEKIGQVASLSKVAFNDQQGLYEALLSGDFWATSLTKSPALMLGGPDRDDRGRGRGRDDRGRGRDDRGRGRDDRGRGRDNRGRGRDDRGRGRDDRGRGRDDRGRGRRDDRGGRPERGRGPRR